MIIQSFAVHLQLTEHSKSTVLQLKRNTMFTGELKSTSELKKKKEVKLRPTAGIVHLLNKSIYNQFLILAARENALSLGWGWGGADISLVFFLMYNT